MNSQFELFLFVLFSPVLWLGVLEIPLRKTFIPFFAKGQTVLGGVLANFGNGRVHGFQEGGFE